MIIENWVVVIVILCIGVSVGIAFMKFVQLPTNEQMKKVQEWMLIAVVEAEKKLKSGTGQLKLRMVYGMFIDKFPKIANAISFDQFSKMVDEALDIMREMLAINSAVRNYIEK